MMITGYVVAVEDDPKDFQEYKGDRECNATVEDPGGHIILFFPGTDYIKKHQAAIVRRVIKPSLGVKISVAALKRKKAI